MSKAVKPLIILIFLLSIAALVLGHMLYGQRDVIKKRTENLETSTERVAANIQYQGVNRAALQDPERMVGVLDGLGKASKDQRNDLVQTKSTLGEVRTELQETSESLEASKSTNEQLANQVATLETQVAETLQQLEQTRSLLAQRSSSQGTATPIQGTTGEIAALVDQFEALQEQYTSLEQAYEEARDRVGTGEGQVVLSDVEGRVLIVKPDWNFVVIDVGFRDELQNNVVLLVHRDKVPVGKIRTSRVERNMSVAEIISRWDEGGVLTGDIVVSPAAGS